MDALNGRDIDVVLVLVVLPLHLGQAHHPLPLVLHVFQVQELVVILLGASLAFGRDTINRSVLQKNDYLVF